jgi:hypothetical protein
MTAVVLSPLSNRTRSEPLSPPGVSRQLSATTTSASTALTPGIRGVSLLARGADIRFVIGAGAQTAVAGTSHFIANGERLDYTVPYSPDPRIGVIRDTAATANGTLEVTELDS